jgi:hypothetical protein
VTSAALGASHNRNATGQRGFGLFRVVVVRGGIEPSASRFSVTGGPGWNMTLSAASMRRRCSACPAATPEELAMSGDRGYAPK